ncbi:MAG: amidase [Deltaproteobacteria bacterium]|nr:amidase [Deltaproteobacteria bacterium]
MDDAFRFRTVADYANAYRSGATTPDVIAARLLDACANSERGEMPMRFFIAQDEADLRRQARAATDRWARGCPLGLLDGVPVAVKDELDQLPYPTTVGTTFLGGAPAIADAHAVAQLRAAGALLCGKTNMQEIGLGATGINPHHGAVRNPYDPERISGGSSSGSAAVVAAGLSPIALGADGGGSIRIPAGVCGVVGLKPTFGRVSEFGAIPLCWSLAHVGPLAASVQDAWLCLQLIAGADRRDPNTLRQPRLDDSASRGSIEGLRIGWCPRWNEHAAPAVLAEVRRAIDRLCASGARLIELEFNTLPWVRPVQYITIACEMAAAQYENRRRHKNDYAADTRVLLELASQFSAVDFLRAQRVRSEVAQEFAKALSKVDVLATPTIASPAPALRTDALSSGESDSDVLDQLTAFSFPANLTGQPALSVPVGYVDELPVGLQLIGAHWAEATIVRVARSVELAVRVRPPRVLYDLLDR